MPPPTAPAGTSQDALDRPRLFRWSRTSSRGELSYANHVQSKAWRDCPNGASFAVRHLIKRTLPGRFVFPPSNDSCAVAKTVAREMIVRYFDHIFWIDRFPFPTPLCAPPTRTAWSIAGETRRFTQRFKFLCQCALVGRLEGRSKSDVMQQAGIVIKTQQE